MDRDNENRHTSGMASFEANFAAEFAAALALEEDKQRKQAHQSAEFKGASHHHRRHASSPPPSFASPLSLSHRSAQGRRLHVQQSRLPRGPQGATRLSQGQFRHLILMAPQHPLRAHPIILTHVGKVQQHPSRPRGSEPIQVRRDAGGPGRVCHRLSLWLQRHYRKRHQARGSVGDRGDAVHRGGQ